MDDESKRTTSCQQRMKLATKHKKRNQMARKRKRSRSHNLSKLTTRHQPNATQPKPTATHQSWPDFPQPNRTHSVQAHPSQCVAAAESEVLCCKCGRFRLMQSINQSPRSYPNLDMQILFIRSPIQDINIMQLTRVRIDRRSRDFDCLATTFG